MSNIVTDSAEAIPALAAGDIDLAFVRQESDLGAVIQLLPFAPPLQWHFRTPND